MHFPNIKIVRLFDKFELENTGVVNDNGDWGRERSKRQKIPQTAPNS